MTMLTSAGADPTSVSAGFLGFLVFFGLAIALWLLIRNMSGRLRRMNYRQSVADDGPRPPADSAEPPPGSPPVASS